MDILHHETLGKWKNPGQVHLFVFMHPKEDLVPKWELQFLTVHAVNKNPRRGNAFHFQPHPSSEDKILLKQAVLRKLPLGTLIGWQQRFGLQIWSVIMRNVTANWGCQPQYTGNYFSLRLALRYSMPSFFHMIWLPLSRRLSCNLRLVLHVNINHPICNDGLGLLFVLLNV